MNMKKSRHKSNNGRSKTQGSSGSDGSSSVYENNDFRPRNHGQRVNYQQMHDKYMNLAREAMGDGDRIAAEFNYQYADHYLRLIRERQYHAQERRTREQQVVNKEVEIEKTDENLTQETSLEGTLETQNPKTTNPIVDAIVGELSSSSQ